MSSLLKIMYVLSICYTAYARILHDHNCTNKNKYICEYLAECANVNNICVNITPIEEYDL